MQKQQKLMEETHRLEQSLRDRMQRGDPLDDQGLNNNEDPFQEMTPPGQDGQDGQPQAGDPKGKEQSPEDKMTADQLREALKALKERQSQLQKDLKGMEKKLSELGMKPMPASGTPARRWATQPMRSASRKDSAPPMRRDARSKRCARARVK